MELLAVIGFVALIILHYYIVQGAHGKTPEDQFMNYFFSVVVLAVIIIFSAYIGKTYC